MYLDAFMNTNQCVSKPIAKPNSTLLCMDYIQIVMGSNFVFRPD